MVLEATEQVASMPIENNNVPQIQPTESFANLLDAIRATSNQPLLSENSLSATSDKTSSDSSDSSNFPQDINVASTVSPYPGAEQKHGDKPLGKTELMTETQMTPEEKKKTAKELADKIAEKGFTNAPELRDKIRATMLRVYMDGDRNGPGNDEAMKDFVDQISNECPQSLWLNIDENETNKDFTDFRKRAQDAINKQVNMKMGTCGQLQLLETKAGKTIIKDKMHFAASIVKDPPKRIFD